MNLRKLLKDNKGLSIYTVGSLFKTAVQIIANAIILVYIDPEDMGVFNTFALFQTYALFAQAGITNGLNRELPYSLGEGDDKKALRLASTAMLFTLISIVVVIITGTILYILQGDTFIKKLSIITVVLLTALRFYESYLTSTFRSNQSFEKLGKAFIFRALAGIVTIPLVIWFDYEGYLARFLLISFLLVGLMFVVRPIKEILYFGKDEFILMLKTGMPIFGLSYFFQTIKTADRFLLATLYGTEYVGYYSFAIMTYAAFSTLPSTIANYIYPKFSYALGQKETMSKLWEHAWKSNAAMFIILLPLAILGYFITPWVVVTFFPKYTMGIAATQIILFAGVFSGATIGGNLLWSLKAWKYMIQLQIIGGVLIGLSVYLSIQFFPDKVTAAAIGMLIGEVFYFVLSNAFIYLKTHE